MNNAPTELVKVQFKNKHLDTFGGPEYSYAADVPLAVGDIVNVPTRWGDKQAKVCKVSVPFTECGCPLDKLLHITDPATVAGDVFADFFN